MSKIFLDQDASLDPLRNLQIGIIGYGNQGRAHALNLKDSGLAVQVATRPNSSAEDQAIKDGFVVSKIEELAAKCEVLAIMLPDEAIPRVYQKDIAPYHKSPGTFVFAHGFVIRHKTITLPKNADIVLVAPTSPGRLLRSLYCIGKGPPALVAVENNASGSAWERCLAYAKGIGCTRSGAIETTFEEETITNLFCEQAVLCGGIPELIKNSFDVLVENGYQPELAYIFCLSEVKLIADLLYERGIDGMRSAISNTAKYGSALAGPEIINSNSRKKIEKLLRTIESGKFAQQFIEEANNGSPTIKNLLRTERNSKIARVGRELQKNLDF